LKKLCTKDRKQFYLFFEYKLMNSIMYDMKLSTTVDTLLISNKKATGFF